MNSPWLTADVPRGSDYDERWVEMARRGQSVHGEANFVSVFQPRTVLDAGCGTGRVAIELARSKRRRTYVGSMPISARACWSIRMGIGNSST